MNENNYLFELGHKASTFYKARELAMEFIKAKGDTIDEHTATDLVIVSQVWAADFYGETLKENELALRLNINDADVKQEELALGDDLKNLTLKEVLERVLENAS